jgi:carbonyl reductase 1
LSTTHDDQVVRASSKQNVQSSASVFLGDDSLDSLDPRDFAFERNNFCSNSKLIPNTVFGFYSEYHLVAFAHSSKSTVSKTTSNTMLSSSSRIAVVTGANKGIGYFIALQLGASGLFSTIILGCRDPTRGAVAANELQKLVTGGVDFQFIPLTIGDPTSHSAFLQKLENEFGGKVDVLVNNAGFAYKNSDATPFQGQTQKTLQTNYYGLVDFTEKMMPLLRKGRDPRLVNVASMSGRLGQVSKDLQAKLTDPSLTIDGLNALMDTFQRDVQKGIHKQKGWSNTNYGISKLGVIAATKIWARQETSIKVNACCPGGCATDMSSNRGARSPEDGAKNAVIPATMNNPPTGAFFRDYRVSTW